MIVRKKHQLSSLTTLLGIVVACGLIALPAHAQTTKLPISDFVDAQGATSFCVPPVADFFGLSTPVRAASVDYAGLADDYLGGQLGTTTSGNITVRPLRGDDEGKVEVHVDLRTQNALTWVIPYDQNEDSCNQFANNTLLFGHRAPEVAGGAEPGLANSRFQIWFKLPAPAEGESVEMPDLIVGDYELISLWFTATATGPLREAAGLGDDGTPGKCIVSQVAPLFLSGFNGNSIFPVERVELRAIEEVDDWANLFCSGASATVGPGGPSSRSLGGTAQKRRGAQ
jgi:hypothetical protein